MARMAGVDLPADKHVWVSLTCIVGIGRTTAHRILAATGVPPTTVTKDLTEEQVTKIAGLIERDYIVEGNLKRQWAQNIQRLKEIGCYRGLRHRRGLPVRGQRTQTNARTRKGPRKTVAVKRSVKELT
ncbi:MAG: 30S ribosomal protein S13 [Planctomycetes bacterium]|nr:30S ribosomal protein S13 [Planctomycetota bacterium]